MRQLAPLVSAVVMAACSSAPPPAAAPAPLPLQVKDDSPKLPLAGRASAQVVQDHLLGIPKMPGGTIGDYETGGKKYQLFIIEAADAQKAAFLLVDMKDALTAPEYLAHMGGYFGTNGARPIYAFAKLQYLAGVVGLAREEADPIARGLAARLR